jgi:lon-related putative ATP-dependent protease
VIRYFTPEDLRWRFADFKGARTILSQRKPRAAGRIGAVAQERALSAIELGLGIKQRGYNIFVVGAQGTGRTSTVEKVLNERAHKEETPGDVVLLYNFNDKDRPLSVALPPSIGPKLKKSYESLIEKMLGHLEKAFEADSYILARQVIQEECRDKTDTALKEIEAEARDNSFVLSHTGVAITLTPANKKGDALTEEEFEELTDKEKQKLESRAEKLENKLEESMRKVRNAEKESEDAFEELERETARQAIATLFDGFRQTWKNYKRVSSHLDSVEEDILARIRRFIHDDKSAGNETNEAQNSGTIKRRAFEEEEDGEFDEPLFIRYRVNVLVTHAKDAGAPVVFETHPTSSNIIGRIEQRMRGGETLTDFTRIRAGALYRANGGYLILEAQELLRDPGAWEGLKRALKNREIELDDPGEPGRMVALASLRPEPVPLNLKIILIGAPDIYYALARNDPDFQSLFKVKADFDLEVTRTDENVSRYLAFLNSLIREESLLKLSPEGAARIIEHAVRLSGSKNKISCRLGEIADLLREANYWAKKARAHVIEPTHIHQAVKAKGEREGFVETQILDEINHGKLVIAITGKVTGQANALTVVEVGNYEFGIPLRITCQTGCGKGEIIDIERLAEQSGSFHSKGRLIIRGLLSNLFGKDLPFAFHATLCMEQTYSEIDGDSASMAEACALLSALAQVPLDQRFAMTGAIDQMGNVQAVGGINQKIEGFYRVCQEKGSQEIHGVIIPAQNISDAMINEEVLAAAEKKHFNIIGVDSVADAMEILTGLHWDGDEQSIKARCLAALRHFNYLREQHTPYNNYNPTPLLKKKSRVTETAHAKI